MKKVLEKIAKNEKIEVALLDQKIKEGKVVVPLNFFRKNKPTIKAATGGIKYLIII